MTKKPTKMKRGHKSGKKGRHAAYAGGKQNRIGNVGKTTRRI